MSKIGYFLSCEQFGPKELIDQAKRAEAAGFESLWISDLSHPWNDEPGPAKHAAQLRNTWTPASTRYTSSKSARTRSGSSKPGSATCCRS
jgi:alkanesulfonate monooxygenase SsuD/methylene tetrahydromethanopterin reductase-like flavin-dependent oxidoreductase (luciferase family)